MPRYREQMIYRNWVKPFLDGAVAIILLVVLTPVWLAVLIILVLLPNHPVFFRQLRVGKHDTVFSLIKFASMRNTRDASGQLLSDHERMTGFGQLLRKTSLDELPQLWLVIQGRMSLVGPRPLLVEYLPRYKAEHRLRHTVRPGITGLAQVSGRNKLTWEEKFNFDVEYVRKQGFWLDVQILWMTAQAIFRTGDNQQSATQTMEPFNGYN